MSDYNKRLFRCGHKSNVVLGSLMMVFMCAFDAVAADTTYDTIEEVKVSDQRAAIVLTSETHGCAGGGDHFRIRLQDAEMIRLAEAAWLSGRKVSLAYSCTTIDGYSTAWVSLVRAK